MERQVQFVRGSFFAGETLHRSRRRAAPGRAVVPRAGRAADPWHDPAPTGRGVRRRGAAPAGAGADGALRRADLRDREGASGSSHRGRQGRSTRCPGDLIGARVEVRADRTLVRIFHRGQLVKVHPRQAPGRPLDRPRRPARGTRPSTRCATSTGSRRMAAGHGPAIGAYAAALLDIPLPWTKMRQVYALLGLVKKWGAERVDAACASALEHEAINVGLIGRMLERGTEAHDDPAGAARRRRRRPVRPRPRPLRRPHRRGRPMNATDRHPGAARRCCAASSSAAASTPSPNGSPSPAPAAWATPSSSSSSSPTKSPAARPPPPTGAPAPPGSTRR